MKEKQKHKEDSDIRRPIKYKKNTKKLYEQKRIEKGLCIKCKNKSVIKYYCQKHRILNNKRKRVAYLKERFEKEYGI